MMSSWVADIYQAVLLKLFFLLFLDYFISFYDLVISVLFTVKKKIQSPHVSPKTNSQKATASDLITVQPGSFKNCDQKHHTIP